jgi:hypothetical protein
MSSPSGMDYPSGQKQTITGIKSISLAIHGLNLQIIVRGTQVQLGADVLVDKMTVLTH